MSYLSPAEAAEKLEMGYKSLLRLVKSGAFTGAIKVHGSWQIPPKAVEDYKASLNIPKGYLTVAEIAGQLNLTELWVGRLVKKGTFVGAKKHRGSWIVPSMSVQEYILQSSSSPQGFLSFPEAAEYLSVGESWIRNLVLRKILSDVEVIDGIRYIRKECIDEYLKSISPPEGYLSAAQAAQELSLGKGAVNSLVKEGAFPGAKKQKIPYHHAGWIIPVESLREYKESRSFPSDYITGTDIATQLEVSKTWITKLIRQGVILNGKKHNNEWIVPIDEANRFIERERKRQLSTPIELFEFRLAELDVPGTLQKTVALYREFVTLKINSSQGNIQTTHNRALEYISTLKRLFLLLDTEVFLMDAEQLEAIFRSPGMGIRDKRTFIYFLEFCTGKGLCSFSKSYAITPLPVEKREMYSPEQFLAYYSYVRDVEIHIEQAIQSRDYAVTWLYVLMHVIDAWRPSDIVKLPNIALEVCNLQTFDQLRETKFSMEQAQAVINHLYKRVERMYISKTGALGHFLVNQDMIVPTATVLVITEIHRRNKGEMPAKLQHVQCLTYPNCASPTALTCLHCENSIPKIYILISIQHELERLILSIQNTKYPAVRVRDHKFYFKFWIC